MKNNFLCCFLILLLCPFYLNAQENSVEASILFYNVENLFDVKDELETDDNNFTPEGELHWTSKRLKHKLLNISKVILNCSGWNPPEIVALCEIENKRVLEQLISYTPLKSVPYKIIHKESPDHRGIDVAILYNSEHFYPVTYEHYPLISSDNDIINTREILYVKGVLNEVDSLHLFVNHWPSRYSGLLETRQDRNRAATLLRSKVEDINENFKSPKIIIVGDFNDNPTDESIFEILQAKDIETTVKHDALYNLSYNWLKNDFGTLKYQSQWFVFDQIIVSGSLVSDNSGFVTTPLQARIIDFPFLFERDEKYGGLKPFRTYYGFSYNGGFSDHLPILLQLKSSN